MKLPVPYVGIALGIAMLVGSGLSAYKSFPASQNDSILPTLKYIKFATQAIIGSALIFYFSLGSFRPIKFNQAETPSWDASHARPGFQSFAANPVLAKFGRVRSRPPTRL